MWKSRAITVTLLSALVLTTCCISMSGCGRRSAPDYTWYDASGNRIPEKWKTDANGNKLLDEQGRPIPDPHVPYDSYHRPWVFVNGAWAPQSPPAGSSSYRSRSSGLWLFGSSGGSGSSGYRSTSSGTSYRSFSSGSSSSSSSISRGGFGSTGSSSSSSS